MREGVVRRQWLTVKCCRYKGGPLAPEFSNMKALETVKTGVDGVMGAEV